MSKFVVIQLEENRRQYINTDQLRVLHDHKDEDNVVIEFDNDHKIYTSRERAAPLIKWLKGQVAT